MKLTEREQNLLFLLAIVAIGLVGFKFMFVPAKAHAEAMQIQLDEKIAKEAEAKEMMAVAETIDADIAAASKQSDEVSGEFFKAEDVEYFHKWISVLAASNSLVVKNVTITEPTLASVPVYGNTFVTVTYPIKDYYNTMRNSRGDQEAIVMPEEQTETPLREDDSVLKVDITLSVSGTNTQLMNLVDHLSTRNKHIVVNSFAFGDCQSTDIQEAEVNLSVYAIEKENEYIFNGFFIEANELLKKLEEGQN
ncbi:MAG: hypothetical protein ACRCW2_16445 [Cellulosilyticaceae bacterium]